MHAGHGKNLSQRCEQRLRSRRDTVDRAYSQRYADSMSHCLHVAGCVKLSCNRRACKPHAATLQQHSAAMQLHELQHARPSEPMDLEPEHERA